MTPVKQQLLNDEDIRHFIVNGYVNVTADVPTHIHETIYDKTDELFAGAIDFRGDRQYNPLNNILPLGTRTSDSLRVSRGPGRADEHFGKRVCHASASALPSEFRWKHTD